MANAVQSEMCSQQSLTQLNQLLLRVQPYQTRILQHSLYDQLNSLTAIRVFMRSHVFAVWDNMLLLKTLQQRLTCVTTPWLPPSDAIATRLINEIILDEESEEIRPGEYLSHVEFYIAAMEEIGADTQPIRSLLLALGQGKSLKDAIAYVASAHDNVISPAVPNFVLHTGEICQGSTPAIVASFLLGREAVVAPLFAQLHRQLETMQLETAEESETVSCKTLKAYCQRHLIADESRHIPMGQALLNRICGDSSNTWEDAANAAIASLMARQTLWDDLAKALQQETIDH